MVGTQAARRPWELGVRRTTGGKPGLQVLGRARGGGTQGRQFELHLRRGQGGCLGKHGSPRSTHCVLQLKDQAGGTVPQRSTLRPWMWLLVLPPGLCWNSPNHVTLLPPPSASPSYLCQENLPVCKSHHDFRMNGHTSLLLPVPLALCPRPGRASSGLGALGAAQGPPSWLSLA